MHFLIEHLEESDIFAQYNKTIKEVDVETQWSEGYERT